MYDAFSVGTNGKKIAASSRPSRTQLPSCRVRRPSPLVVEYSCARCKHVMLPRQYVWCLADLIVSNHLRYEQQKRAARILSFIGRTCAPRSHPWSPTQLFNRRLFFTASKHAPCTIYAVMAYEMTNIASRILFSSDGTVDKATQADLSDRLHDELIEKYMRRCKCVDSPVCRLTMEWCAIYRDRLKLLLFHWDKVHLRRVAHREPVNLDGDLLACIRILEKVRQLRLDATYSQWAWVWHNCVEWVCIQGRSGG
jgi:hypothetical protein